MVQAKEPFVSDEKERGYQPLSCAKCGEPLPNEYDENTLVCDLCGQGHKSLVPPPVANHAIFSTGDGVAVSWGDRWWSAHIVEMVGTDRYLVHYEGWGPRYDEVVDASRIRRLDFVPGTTIVPPQFETDLTVKRGSLISALGIIMVMLVGIAFLMDWLLHDQIFNPKSPSAAEIEAANFGAITDRLPGLPIRADFHIEAGQSFYVKWGHGWYLGTVVMVENQDQILVQYDGWGDYQNEIVTRDRLRVIP